MALFPVLGAAGQLCCSLQVTTAVPRASYSRIQGILPETYQDCLCPRYQALARCNDLFQRLQQSAHQQRQACHAPSARILDFAAWIRLGPEPHQTALPGSALFPAAAQTLPALIPTHGVPTWPLTTWSVQMILSLIVVSISLAIVGTKVWVAWFVLVFVCIYISAYAW